MMYGTVSMEKTESMTTSATPVYKPTTTAKETIENLTNQNNSPYTIDQGYYIKDTAQPTQTGFFESLQKVIKENPLQSLLIGVIIGKKLNLF